MRVLPRREAAQTSAIVSAIGCMFYGPSREGPPATAPEFVRVRCQAFRFTRVCDVGQLLKLNPILPKELRTAPCPSTANQRKSFGYSLARVRLAVPCKIQLD